MRDDVTFGAWVRGRRRALDLTQAELADRLSYSTITVRRLEAGTRRPSKELVERLALHLGVGDDEVAVFRELGRSLVGTAPGPVHPPGDALTWSRRAVPHPLSAMVGRSEEQERVLAFLRRGARLVSVTGPGGVGKTRLAAGVGHRAAEAFDEVCWVPLSGVSDPGAVISAVTEAMGLGVREGRVPAVSASRLMRRWLVILDTLEHLMGATPALVDLLEAVPDLSLVVTTRTALRVPGEVEVALAPMAVPEVGDRSDHARLLASPAVTLFRAAARRVRPDFDIDEQSAPAVVTICRKVDGLPLGLEIAASNLRVLSVQDLALRMSAGRWPEPQVGDGSRHRSLETTMDASVSLLTPAAQAVLRRAAVFAGGWSLPAAEAVCADDALPADHMLSIHAELRDHSMITLDVHAGASRYTMLDTVRRFSLQGWCDAGARGRTEQRHAAYYSHLAAEACGLLVSSHQVRCLELISYELDNFRAAMDRAVSSSTLTGDPGQTESVLLTAARLERFWSTTGRSAEGIRRLRGALLLPAAQEEVCVAARAEALGALAVLEAMQQQFASARSTAQQMRRLAERRNDRRQLCTALRNLGTIAVLQNDTAGGEELLRACLAVAEHTPGTAHVQAWTLSLLGSAAFLSHDLSAAAQRYAVAIPRLRELEDLNFLALTLRRQGQIDLVLDRTDSVVPLLQESLRHNLALRSPTGIAACLVVLAEVARVRGQARSAAEGLGRAEALLEVSGERLTRPDQDQHDSCRAAVEQRLGRADTLELLAAGSRKPWEQIWLS